MHVHGIARCTTSLLFFARRMKEHGSLIRIAFAWSSSSPVQRNLSTTIHHKINFYEIIQVTNKTKNMGGGVKFAGLTRLLRVVLFQSIHYVDRD